MPELSIDQKSLLATGLLAIACVQLLTIAVGRGAGGFSPGVRRWAVGLHRFGGYLGLFIVLLVAYSCVVFIGPKTGSLRVAAHSLLGASVIALLFGKITIARGLRQYYPRLPIFGAALFAAVIVNWFISAGWYYFAGSVGY